MSYSMKRLPANPAHRLELWRLSRPSALPWLVGWVRFFAKKKGHEPSWVHRHVTDMWVKRAQADSFRSRAAYKLMQLDDRGNFLRKRQVVVDLGCFPGGWSQVVLNRSPAATSGGKGCKLISVDRLQMDPLPYTNFIKGDVGDPATVQRILEEMKGDLAGVVLSDMAPKMIGSQADDHLASADTARLAISLAEQILKPGGTFVVKMFKGPELLKIEADLKTKYQKVQAVKPKASRLESPEIFLVCSQFGIPPKVVQDAIPPWRR
eukprot:gnl/MRDRNA2_/MRDRNA2_17130_c0_seq1.p1 gnl/MRDRNA2_/MRDRNA2_17130_c0~~gnl/MRDRNA2_/MRDRNA2_17130_c0_seq1.p1  ORF type:complete len:264 (+),score=44.32 gnl/MRDRNA2_/MRDRNA2_17130_c0_seq1:128-919(+)